MKRLLAAAFLLSGCLSAEEQMAKDTEASKLQCVEYGFKAGTPQFSQCLLLSNQMIENKRQQQAQAWARAGESFQRSSAIAAANRPVQTSCYRTGNFVNCNSY